MNLVDLPYINVVSKKHQSNISESKLGPWEEQELKDSGDFDIEGYN